MVAGVPAVNERAHIERALRAYVDSWATNDVEGRLALFADDVVIEDPVTVRQATGKAELTEFVRAGIPENWSMAFSFERVAVVGDEAILTYRIALHAGHSSPAELLVNSHVVFDANGLIAQYRTFFDTESITDHPSGDA
jgi:ketosteroid isomerase-like protein